MKKDRTPEEQAKIDARMAKMRAAREAKKDQPQEQPEGKTTYSDADIAELIKQVQELKADKVQFAPSQQQVNGGRLIGTFEKYVVDPSHYPSPVERLTSEPKLARFAFPLNYELVFKTEVSSYETKDGINTKEPRFTLQLVKIVMDEDSGDPTNGRYMLYQMIFHEDPQAALILAQERGLPVDESNEAEFLNEMRYLRMRDWLFQLEPFYPKPATSSRNKKEMVVGNRLVEFYEVSGEQPQSIPMSDLSKKL